MAVHTTIDGWTRDELVTAVAYWRGRGDDIKRVWRSGRWDEQQQQMTGPWEYAVSKTELAKALWPALRAKIDRCQRGRRCAGSRRSSKSSRTPTTWPSGGGTSHSCSARTRQPGTARITARLRHQDSGYCPRRRRALHNHGTPGCHRVFLPALTAERRAPSSSSRSSICSPESPRRATRRWSRTTVIFDFGGHYAVYAGGGPQNVRRP